MKSLIIAVFRWLSSLPFWAVAYVCKAVAMLVVSIKGKQSPTLLNGVSGGTITFFYVVGVAFEETAKSISGKETP